MHCFGCATHGRTCLNTNRHHPVNGQSVCFIWRGAQPSTAAVVRLAAGIRPASTKSLASHHSNNFTSDRSRSYRRCKQNVRFMGCFEEARKVAEYKVILRPMRWRDIDRNAEKEPQLGTMLVARAVKFFDLQMLEHKQKCGSSLLRDGTSSSTRCS